MKRFQGTVTEEREITVILDETVFTEEWLAEWRGVFYDFDTIDQHVQHIAEQATKGEISYRGFLEGYGYIKTNGKYGCSDSDEPKMNIDVRFGNEEIEADMEEIKTKEALNAQ